LIGYILETDLYSQHLHDAHMDLFCLMRDKPPGKRQNKFLQFYMIKIITSFIISTYNNTATNEDSPCITVYAIFILRFHSVKHEF